MARLPVPGSDAGNWGTILNDYLSQVHTASGTLKDGAITAGALAPSSVTAAALAPNAVSNAVLADGAVTASNLNAPTGATNGQVLTLDSTAPGGFKWAAAPTGSFTQQQVDWNATSGVAQILNKPTLGTAASANTTAFATAAQGTKADSAVQPGSLATVATSGSYGDLTGRPSIPTTLGSLTDVTAAGPSNGQVLTYNSTSSKWVASTVTSTTVSDATTAAKGIVQLTGDLGGTAASPTVPGLASKADASAVYTKTQADSTFILATQKGANSGVATLDSSGKVPSSQLPAATAQQNADWNATSGVGQILNKPVIPAAVTPDTDTTLGGATPSDSKVSSQKATKTYVDTAIATNLTSTTGFIKNQNTTAQTAAVWVSDTVRTDKMIDAKAPYFRGYWTQNTTNTAAGQWTKLCTMTLGGQYSENRITCEAVAIHDAGSAQRFHIDFRQKQESAMGQDPYVEIRLFNAEDVTCDDLVAITTQKTTSTTVTELWGRINTSYTAWGIVPHITSSAGSASTTTWYESQAFTSTLPTGTQVKAQILPIIRAATDPASAVNGVLYYNTSLHKVRVYQNGAWADLGGGSGAVQSVVGQTGVITGTQIANNTDVANAFYKTIVKANYTDLTLTIAPFQVEGYTHPGGGITALPSGEWYVGTDIFTGNILTLPRLGHRGWVPLARITTDATKVITVQPIHPKLYSCRIPRTMQKLQKGQPINVVVMGSSLAAGGTATDWSGMVFGSGSTTYYKVPGSTLVNVGVGGSPNQYQLAQLGLASGHTGYGFNSSGAITMFTGKRPPNGRSKLFDNVDVVVIGCLANGGDYRLETIEPLIRKLRTRNVEVVMVTDNAQGPSGSYASMINAGLYVDAPEIFRVADLFGVEVADTAAYVFETHLRKNNTGVYSDTIHMTSAAPAGRTAIPSCGHEAWARAVRSIFSVDLTAGTPIQIGNYDFASGQGSWYAYGTPVSVGVINGALACQADSTFDGVQVNIGTINSGDAVTVTFDLTIGAGMAVEVGLLNGSWASSGNTQYTTGGAKSITLTATSTASMALAFINFNATGTFTIDNVIITHTPAAGILHNLTPGRTAVSTPLPPHRLVADLKSPGDAFVILPTDELYITAIAATRGTLQMHPWKSSSFQRRFIGGTDAAANDMLVLAVGKECVIGAHGTVGWSLIRYAEPADPAVTVEVYIDNNLQKTLTLATVPFANEWHHTIYTPTELAKSSPTDDTIRSIKLKVTAGTLKVAALIALTADVSFIGPEEITYIGTWSAKRETSRTGLPGFWTDTANSHAFVRNPGNRLEWIVEGSPKSKTVDIYASADERLAESCSGTNHVYPKGGLVGKDAIHTVKCLENNTTSTSNTDGRALYIFGAIVYHDR